MNRSFPSAPKGNDEIAELVAADSPETNRIPQYFTPFGFPRQTNTEPLSILPELKGEGPEAIQGNWNCGLIRPWTKACYLNGTSRLSRSPHYGGVPVDSSESCSKMSLGCRRSIDQKRCTNVPTARSEFLSQL